ncbi:MAG: hypothetical protein ABW004_03440 [Aeromicrobium sp.]
MIDAVTAWAVAWGVPIELCEVEGAPADDADGHGRPAPDHQLRDGQ